MGKPVKTKDPFYDLLDKMRAIHNAKAADYSGESDPYLNFRYCGYMGIPAWQGVLVRMSDKFSRLMTLAGKDELLVKSEKIEDTLLDLANYCLICLLLYEEAHP